MVLLFCHNTFFQLFSDSPFFASFRHTTLLILATMSMSKLAPDPNPNVMPNTMVAHLVKHLGKIKIVYLTAAGPTEDPSDPGICGTFYSASNLPDTVVERLHAAILAVNASQEMSEQRMSMGNKLERRYALFGEGVWYKFASKWHKGVADDDVQALIDYMAELMQTPFNSILANEYATPGASISAHSDDERGVATLNIPGISVAPRNPLPGCEYKFLIRTISKPGARAKTVFDFEFPALCLFGMYGRDFQRTFTHAVPAGRVGRGTRTSLTFRVLADAPKQLPTKRKADQTTKKTGHTSTKRVDNKPDEKEMEQK